MTAGEEDESESGGRMQKHRREKRKRKKTAARGARKETRISKVDGEGNLSWLLRASGVIGPTSSSGVFSS